MSYMVGFGERFPKKIHHRASSLPSLATYPGHIGCQAGFQYLDSNSTNPNILTGAVVGGPDQNDTFTDDRKDFSHAEPATYINAPLVGSLAYLISDELTAYQMLEKYDFPKGILPQGVQSYALNQAGSFEVYLNGDCEFEVTGGYLLHYKRRITGTVGVGSLTNLRGVRVKVLFLWFGINEVVRSGDELKFYLGPLSASFGLSNFEECPSCRCGFDCADAMVSDS
ncbi:hypothetical protein B296_00005774 [Ensete ventricosum]|uniref:Endoglucanase n=1 Tax=Ensete ventricosum TaxID=4639 RepID=A0A426ZWD3_ENSVE|nr:hypothetical protein B296_00005774 [Ensete ventricosum]